MGDNINILDELKDLNATSLINIGKKNIYFLPDGFFDDFPGNITRQIWLNSVSKINPYYLPAGYFENLPELILDKLALNQLSATVQNLYSTPNGYFNTLADNILEKIKAKTDNAQQELEELSPLLSSISKANVYTVPAGYFVTLNPAQHEVKAEPAKVISIAGKTRRWISYAAAACIAALMFGGGYYYLQQPDSTSNTPNQYAGIKVDQAISQLSDVELDNYLKKDNSDVYIPQSDMQDVDFKTLLENMSDEEINNYLLQNSDPGENMKGS